MTSPTQNIDNRNRKQNRLHSVSAHSIKMKHVAEGSVSVPRAEIPLDPNVSGSGYHSLI